LDDDELTRDLGGFPLIGEMKATEYQSAPMTKVQKRVLSREEALDKRSFSNIEVLDRVKESEFAEDIHKQTQDEAQHGRMTYPRTLCKEDLIHLQFARRIAVE
jgi:hypothetical protein